jgi:bacterioferritin (cytochrome b1)
MSPAGLNRTLLSALAKDEEQHVEVVERILALLNSKQ